MNYNQMPTAPAYGNYTPLSPMGAQYMPVQPQQTPQTPSFGVRPVTGREEAVAAQVDFCGPGTLMPDLGHGIIYLKRFNPNTGACDLFAFPLAQPEQPTPQPQYATMEDLNALREELTRKPKGGKRGDADE